MAAVHTGATDFVLFSHNPHLAARSGKARVPFGDADQGLIPSYNMAGMRGHDEYLDQGTPSYEPFGSVPSFTMGPTTYFQAPQFTFDSTKEMTGQPARGPTPSASPSSFSQSYDQPPSIMSSASGASGQSTNSSADGSPHAQILHQLPPQDKWSQPLHGLGLGPSIVGSDQSSQESYPIHEFEHDMALDDSKYGHFVGEYQKTSSTVSSEDFTRALPPFSGISSRKHDSTLCSSPLALDNNFTSLKPVTIDTILDEVKRKTQATTQLLSPISVGMTSPVGVRSTKIVPSPQMVPTPINPPLTPASSCSIALPRMASPAFLEEHKSSLQNLTVRSITPLLDGQTRSHTSQDPFFSQSSGRFIAPLESTCSFSYKSISF